MFSAATKTGGGVSLGPADDYYKYVTMLLPGNGTNGAQNNTFVDSSSNAFSITRNGNTTQGSFSPYGSLWSNYFNGSSSLEFPTPSSYYFGTNDFTVECWVNFSGLNGTGGHSFIGDWSNSNGQAVWGIFFNDQSNLIKFIYGNNTTKNFSWTPSIGIWYHIALCRSSGTLRCFVNGTQVGSDTSFTDNINNTYATNKFYLGSARNGAAFLDGYLSNVRVNNTALYTSNFTPSTTPLTAVSGTIGLMSQSNRFIDNSSSAATITVGAGTPSVQRFSPFNPTAPYDTATIGGSGYFVSSSSQYLSWTNSTAMNMGTGNFTYECWVNIPTISTFGMIYSSSNANNYIGVNGNGSGWNVDVYDGTNNLLTTANALKFNTWYHIAFVRSGSTGYIYVNGVLATSGTFNNNFGGSTGTSYIGRTTSYGSSYYYFNGYISDFRAVKGTAVYTTTFTPPTAPLTAISGTSFLENFTNAGIPDYAMMNDLETVGNAQVSTSVKKFGTGSLYFDGTGDYLKAPYIAGENDLNGNFTIEFWLYYSSGSPDLVATASNYDFLGTNKSGWMVGYTGSLLRFGYQSNNGWVIDQNFTGTGLTTNTWYHIAVVRNNGTIKIYVNGTASSTTVSNSSNLISTSYGVHVGCDVFGVMTLTGYMDDVRITKGYARYTANFTPPTAAFPTY